MKKKKNKTTTSFHFEEKTIPISLVDVGVEITAYEKKDIKTRAAYITLNGVPVFSVNEKENGRFMLLSGERDFYAAKFAGLKECQAHVYAFNEKNAEIFSIAEKLKNERLTAMEEGYLMRALLEEYAFTQEDIAALIGKSRPAIANTVRLLKLSPEVIGLVESKQLSAGHARALVKVPKDMQFAFAQEAIKREYSVREMERAVKTFMTPPEVLQQETAAKNAEKNKQLKAFIERMRAVYRTKVSLIGNDKKGRIYIDYYSPEDLYRFEEFLDIIENFQG